MFDRLEDDFLWDIGVDISPKYMGDDMVLLLCLFDDRAKRMMKEETEGGLSLFHSLEKWNSKLRPRCRLTWVNCWGIPLVAWNMEHIRKIVAGIGDLVDVDDDVEVFQRLDRARILIKTSMEADYTTHYKSTHPRRGVRCAYSGGWWELPRGTPLSVQESVWVIGRNSYRC